MINDAEAKAIAEAMRVLADTSLDRATAMDAEHIWWRAQVLRRAEMERRAGAPVDVGVTVSAAAGSVLAGAIAILFWQDATGHLALLGGLTLGALGLAALTAFRAAWKQA